MKAIRYSMLVVVACWAASTAARGQEMSYDVSQAYAPAGNPYYTDTDVRDWGGFIGGGGRTGIYAGGAVYFLKPYAEQNEAYARTDGYSGTNRARTTTELDWSFSTSPAVWVGWEAPCGWGVRSRVFLFQQTSNPLDATMTVAQAADQIILPAQNMPDKDVISPASSGSPGIILTAGYGTDQLTYTSSLRVNAVDLEGTCDMKSGHCTLLFGGGVRYLHLSQEYNQHLYNTYSDGINTATENSTLNFLHEFEGVGPIVSVQASHGVGGLPIALFGTLRGGLLAGTMRRNLYFNQTVSDPGAIVGGDQTTTHDAVFNHFSTLASTEIEVGAEYTLNFYRFDLVTRVALVEQTYFGAGSASSEDGLLSLFGGQVSMGLNF
jgi:hypothetical protein